jgi:hypothetical protein
MINMKRIVLLQSVLIFLFVLPAHSQNDTIVNPLDVVDTLSQDFGLFTNDDILDMSLRFDLTHYKSKKPKDEYMKAILTYHISETDSVNKEVRLKSRGEFRNGYCDLPPIRLNFSKAGFQKDDLKKIDKLKMVTHCKYGNERYLLKEYLIYKLYNVLTDYSFRVRLVNIEYINTYKKTKPIKTFAFFIEPIEILGERTKSIPIDAVNLSQKQIIPEMMDRLAIFNYMIGNTDWSVPNQHNCKVLTPKTFNSSNLGLIVPYDFDYSGLVDADYAVPYEGLGLESVRDRRYVGICRTEDTFISALREFSDKKEEFYKVINDFTPLNEKERLKMIKYLDSFYNRFDKRNSIVYDILGGCTNF